MLAPWKKSYDNLESILKSRDITLPTKVCLVKPIVFPVVMYGCENWIVKKAEKRSGAFPDWTCIEVDLLWQLSDCPLFAR